jgi:hypothetical protein
MAMDKQSMKDKVKQAYLARTGELMTEGAFNALIDLCQGIIEELLEEAVVEVEVTSGSSAGTYEGIIKS